jgi:toxin ParE1/3/4
MPGIGAAKTLRHPALQGLRSWPVQGFEDIRIYYVVQGEILKVVRVLHGKRDINRILGRESAGDDM